MVSADKVRAKGVVLQLLLLLSIATLKCACTNVGLSHNLNLCIDAQSNGGRDMYEGGQAQAWQCAATDNQQITFVDQNVRFGQAQRMCLTVQNNQFQPGTRLVVQKCINGVGGQIWRYLPSGQIQNVVRPEFCVHVSNGQYRNGNPLDIQYCSKGDLDQTFSVNGKVGWDREEEQQQPRWVQQLFPNKNKRILAWGVDDRFLKNIIGGTKIAGLYHWQMQDVKGNYKLFMPMYWGDSKTNEWRAQLQALGNTLPKVVLAFNEPDIGPSPGSAGMDPYKSAAIYKREIHDRFAGRGSVLVGPSINWDYSGWLRKFMTACDQMQCQIDAIGYHVYVPLHGDVMGAVNEVKDRVQKVYAMYKKPLMITEIGLQKTNTDTPQQIKQFMLQIADFLDGQDYVASWAFSGCYVNGQAWDGYMTNISGFFNADGSLTDLGYAYAWG